MRKLIVNHKGITDAVIDVSDEVQTYGTSVTICKYMYAHAVSWNCSIDADGDVVHKIETGEEIKFSDIELIITDE